MQHSNPSLRADASQGGLEFEGLVHALAYEGFDGILTPGLETTVTEAAGKALDPYEADAVDDAAIAIEHGHSTLTQNALDVVLFAGFVIVVAEDSEHG